MFAKVLKSRFTKAWLLISALGVFFGVSGSNLASAVAVHYCGEYTYDQWGSRTAVAATYNSGYNLCEATFSPDLNTEISVSQFALPAHVSSVEVLAVGGGGSGAWDTANWATFYFSGGNTDNITGADSGGGGGGGAVWQALSYPVNSSFRFDIGIGEGGRIDPYNSGAMMGGYMGNDGTATTLAIFNGSTTTTLTAGAGRAPSPHGASGIGGTATPASFAGWSKYSGTNGLSASMNNTSPYGGVSAYGYGAVGQGGGGSSYSSNSAGNRGTTFGGGGGGGMINNGAWASQDLTCYVFNDNRCDARGGVVRFTWAPLDYEPAAPLDPYQPVSLTSVAPKVGNTLSTYQSFTGSPAPTISYQWYRCTSQLYDTPVTTLPAGCTAVSGQTASDYLLTTNDLGKYMINRVTATNSGTSGTTTINFYTPSSSIVVNTPAAPSLGAATALGPTTVRFDYVPSANWGEWRGYKVAATTGGVTTNRDATYDGVTGKLTLTGLAANTAYTFRAFEYSVDGGDGALSAATQSGTTKLAVTNSGTPSIAADTRVGKTATYTRIGSWSGNTTPTTSYAWYYCNTAQTAVYQSEGVIGTLTSGCTTFGSATTATATLTSTQLGKYITVIETATDSYSTAYYRAASTAVVTGEMDAVTITSAVRGIHANNTPNATITFNLPVFTGSNSAFTQVNYQWTGNGGATWQTGTATAGSSTSFTVQNLMHNVAYYFKISVYNGGGWSAWSAQSQQVVMPAAIAITSQGALTGSPVVGATLSAGASTYTNPVATTTITSNFWYHCSSSKVAANNAALANLNAGCTLIGSGASMTSWQATSAALNRHVLYVQQVYDTYSYRYNGYATVQVTGVPDAPTAVSGSGASATSATITFTPSAVTPYAAITSYKFDYSAGPSYSSWSTVATTGAGTATTFTITGLTGATNYKVRVYAVNSSGTSAASVASAAFSTYAAAAITGTPSITGSVTVGSTLTADETSLVVTGTPTATLTRSWYACDNTTDALTLSGSCAAISGETTDILALTGSQSMKYIVYRVVATNSTGSAAVVSSATTQVPGVPGAPTGVSMTALSTTSLRVDYTLPTDIGGGALTGIQYQISVAPYSVWSAYTSASDMSGTFTVSGLTAGTSYKVILRAVNAIGNGVATAASAAVSTFGAPTVAIAPTLAGTAHVGQTLSATEPAGMFAGNPAPTVSSRAWYACATTKAAGDSLADCSAIAGATVTSLTIASAQVGTYIVFTATGTNTEGSVTAGSASSAIIAAAPAAPSISLTSLSSSTAATITATLGAANNAAITEIEYELDGSGTWVSTGSANLSFTVGSLTAGQQYSLKIRARNAVGVSVASSATAITPLSAPAAATASRADSSLTLNWAAVPGATGYAVSYSTSAGSGFAVAPGSCGSTSSTTCTLTALTNSQGYYIKLTATNLNGSSPLSVVAGPFTPLSQDTTLSALVLRSKTSPSANAIGVAFGAAFASSTRAYAADVPAGSQYVTLTPTRSLAGQLIKVNGVTVASAASSADIPVAYGTNTITVEVQSVEKVTDSSSTATANYVLTVTRLAPDMTGFTAFSATANNQSDTSSNAAAPLPTTYSSIGITGVTTANVAAINSAISSLPAAAIDTPAELQAVVNAYTAVLAQSTGGGQSAPTAAEYVALGVAPAANFNAGQLAYLNSVIAVQGSSAVASIATVTQIASAIADVYAVAAATSNSTMTVDQLVALGITGVTSANLAEVLAAITATADDGSGINTVAKIQALVNTVKASSVTNIATPSTTPTPTVFAAAGVTRVTTSNVTAINTLLASLPSTAKDATDEIQNIVDSYQFILAQAAGVSLSSLVEAAANVGASSLTAGPTAANYSAIGASVAAALNTSGLSLLNSLLGNQQASAIDSAAEINAIAAAVSTVQTNVSAATVDDFAALGLRGVTSTNLAAVRALIAAVSTSSKDSFAELQAIIDNSLTVVSTSAFANAVSATSIVAPTVQDFISLGITGVSGSNVAAINTAIRQAAAAANPAGSWVATPTAIQQLIDSALVAQVASISSYSGSGAAPALVDYQSLGVVGVKAANIDAINAFIASLPSTTTDSTTEVQAVVAAYAAVATASTTGKSGQLTIGNLDSLGITGVTTSNFAAIAAAIAAAAATSVDTQAELQALVSAAVAAASVNTSTLVSFAANPIALPTLSTYVAAGVIGVTTANKAVIDQALAAANPAPSTLADIQAIVASVTSATVAQIASPTAVTTLRTNDFAVAGITGVTNTNRAAVAAVLAQLPAAARDSVAEIQAVVDSYSLIAAAALGGSNLAADAPKPTAADFAAIGVDLGAIANDPEAFAFFIKVLAKLPADVVASPDALTDRAFVVANLLRAASNKPTVGTLTATDLNSIGFAAVTSTNISSVLTEISTGSNGVAGLDSIEVAAVKYAVVVATPVAPTPTPTTPGVDPTPTPTPSPTPSPVVVPVPAPKTVGFAAGSTTLSPAAKVVVQSQVTKLLQAKAKTVVIRSVASLPNNSSTAWTAQVIAAAKARANAVASVVAAKVKALRTTAKVVIKVTTTTVANTRVVKISGTK